MARIYANRSSRGMRNLGSAANGIGKAAGKGFQALARQNASVASHAARSSSTMEMMWGANCSMACMDLRFRRFDRMLKQHNRLMRNEKTNVFEVAYGWIVDHLLLLRDVLWGIIQPILIMVFMALYRAVLIIVCNVIFFGAIYLLLTA